MMLLYGRGHHQIDVVVSTADAIQHRAVLDGDVLDGAVAAFYATQICHILYCQVLCVTLKQLKGVE